MRNLMIAATGIYAVAIGLAHAGGFGNMGLWLAFLTLLAARGASQALAYPGLARRTFAKRSGA
jgi:MATE family multidrug resistance protein